MSAKSLGTLVMIYATDELQNHLPLKTMLCEGDMNNSMMYFCITKGFCYRLNIVCRREGVCTPIGDTKKGKEWENL